MAQPPPYNPVTSFITYQAQQAWFPGQQLDVEFNAIDTSISAIETNLALIQKDDGTLANGVVGFPQLSTTLASALITAGVVVPVSTIITQPNTWTQTQTFGVPAVLNAGADMAASSYLNWGATLGSAGYGIRDSGGVLQFKNSGGVWKNFRTQLSVLDYGADNSGVADSTSAINAAVTAAEASAGGIAVVYFPAGVYLISSTVQISSSNVFLVGESSPTSVLITRKTDFGIAFQFSNASAQITTVGMANIEVADVSAINNTAGFSTVATSPYQVVFDGCATVYVENVQLQSGSGCLALKGVLGAYCNNIVLVNPGTSELDSTGVALYVGFSANTNLALRYCSGIHFSVLEIEGGSPFAGKLFDGVRVDGCDGLWVNDGHVQGTLNSSWRLSHSGAFPMSNLFFSNAMADECAGNGIVMDGSVQVQNSVYQGSVSCGAGGGANKAGWTLSGAGGLKNFTFIGLIQGWGGSGIVLNASNTLNVTIRADVFGNNLSAGSNPAISIQNCLNCSIIGGVAGSGDACHPNIAIGASAARVSIAGVLAASSSTFGVTIALGATFVTIAGCDLSGNTSGAISDSSGAITKKFVGNLGADEVLATAGGRTLTWNDVNSGTLASSANLIMNAASGSLIGLSVNGNAVMYVQSTGPIPSADNTVPLGAVGNAWSNVVAKKYSVDSNQVVGARATGWTVATGTPQRATFTTGGVTLPQLAGVVMALEQDLIAHGLIGT